MEVFSEAPSKKRKRYNKNKKKAWRKKINIADIEKHLEDQRREERLGGALGEQTSSELFFLDFEHEKKRSNLKRKVGTFSTNKDGLKPLHNRIEKKKLKCHEFTYGLPGAKAISIKKGTMKQRQLKVIKNAKKLAVGTPKAEEKKKKLIRQRKMDLKKKLNIIQKPDFNKDLWESPAEVEGKFDEKAKTFMEEPIAYYKAQTRQAKIRTPVVRFTKPSLLPSVVIPKGGASYNPSYDDHQKLLAEALQAEEARKVKEQKKQRIIAKYKPTKVEMTELEKIAEMTEGLPLGGGQDYETYNFSEEDEEENDENDNNFIGKRKFEKRSKQSRKKAKTVKIKEQKRLELKDRKRRENDINSLKSLKRKINKEEEEAQLLKQKKKKKKLQDGYRTKRLSRYTFEEKDEIVPLGNELADSLRTLEPVGNPIEAVFKSLQRRNIIETRVKVRKAIPKKKMILKKSCKEPLNLLSD